jgi:hypothetical protein
MLKLINKIMSNKTTSPKGGKRGCLCDDSTYSSKCCEGELINQGIGSTLEQGTSTVTNENGVRTMVRSNG